MPLDMRFPCPVCGETMVEHHGTAECMYCHASEETEWLCPNGHYVCEECRLADQAEIISRACMNTTSKDPVDIAELIMGHTSFNDYGSEHHLLVAPVILTALINSGQVEMDRRRVNVTIKRMEDIPYGVCGTRGGCGASEGVGCAVSMLTGANYLSDRERSLSLRATSAALLALSEMGGPRCCKQSVYSAIETASEALKSMGLELAHRPIVCSFSHRMPECKKEGCPYYPGNTDAPAQG